MPNGFTILTCPLCSTTADVEVKDELYVVEVSCTSCETRYMVEVDPAKVKAHGHVG